jgi:hypothetical protein
MILVSLCPEAPVDQIARIESDAQQIGGDEPELGRTDTDDANDGAVHGGDDPALPELPAQEYRAQDGKNARDVIQTNVVK